jgi:hypothetical protein
MNKILFNFTLTLAIIGAHCKIGVSQSTMVDEISGSCGSLTWVLTENGDLKIAGNGEMPKYGFIRIPEPRGKNYPTSPWGGFKDVIYSLTIEEGVLSVGQFAFAYCENLKKVTLPQSLISIGDAAFRDCNFSSIDLPNSIIEIGEEAFSSCNLQNVNIPDNITKIGEGAFSGNNKLKTIYISERNEHYCSMDGVLFTKDKKILVQYPAGKEGNNYKIPKAVKRIGNSAFDKSKLTEIDIPEGVTEIGVWAFNDCKNLSEVYLPKTLEKIEYYAFCWLYLKSITCLAPKLPFADHQSFDVNEDCVLTVAKGMKNVFANDKEWSRSIKTIKEKN